MKSWIKYALSIQFFLMLQSFVFAQNPVAQLQQRANLTIKKVYAASVRMWGFDVEKNERNSGQFSGVVVNAEGLILTAAHTVAPGRTYKVFFPDGREVIAKALGRIDLEATPGIPDAGMLQIIEKGSYPFAELGVSGTLAQDEPCLSISYPEKLNQEKPTVRFGKIITAKNQYGFIQSTCKMEPGDSGGPLFDINGQVIGIHSAIDVSEDSNFEIPIDIYRKYWSALHKEINYTEYPTADSLLTAKTGAKPKWELPERTTAKKRLSQGTIMLRNTMSGKNAAVTLINYTTENGKRVQLMIGKCSLLGDSLTLSADLKCKIEVVDRDLENDLVLLRASKKFNGGFALQTKFVEDLELGDFVNSVIVPGKVEPSMVGGTYISLPKSSSIPYFGISVRYKSKPAAVSVVKPGSPAEALGIKPNDLILGVNGLQILQAGDFLPAMEKYWSGQSVELEWSSDGKVQKHLVQLIDRPYVASSHPVDRFAGGTSTRRDGFANVFVHDAIILPEQCGTPVVNAEGKLVGINIARYSRAVVLGIKVGTIGEFVQKAIVKLQ